MMFKGGGAALIVIVNALVADCWLGLVESSTLNVVELKFVAVGVPEIAPDALIPKPAGSDEPLLTLKLYGVVPPEAASCPE